MSIRKRYKTEARVRIAQIESQLTQLSGHIPNDRRDRHLRALSYSKELLKQKNSPPVLKKLAKSLQNEVNKDVKNVGDTYRVDAKSRLKLLAKKLKSIQESFPRENYLKHLSQQLELAEYEVHGDELSLDELETFPSTLSDKILKIEENLTCEEMMNVHRSKNGITHKWKCFLCLREIIGPTPSAIRKHFDVGTCEDEAVDIEGQIKEAAPPSIPPIQTLQSSGPTSAQDSYHLIWALEFQSAQNDTLGKDSVTNENCDDEDEEPKTSASRKNGPMDKKRYRKRGSSLSIEQM